MAMNVTNSYTNATAAYDKYAVDKEKAEAIKEEAKNTSQPQQDHSKETEVFFSKEGVKALYDSENAWAKAKEVDTLNQNMWNDYLKSGDGVNYKNKNSSDKAEALLGFYKNKYEKIEKGYADGSRQVYVRDYATHSVRLLTKEEELDQLNQLYNKQANKIANQRRDELTSELIKQGKLERWDAHLNANNRPKEEMPATENAVNAPADIKDFVKTNEKETAVDIMDIGSQIIEDFRKKMLGITNMFAQNFSQQTSGTFDIENFLKNLTDWK